MAQKVKEGDLEKSAAKNKNRTKVWVKVTNQPEPTKAGTFIGTATFHWKDDPEKKGQSQNVVLKGPGKIGITADRLMVKPKKGQAYPYADPDHEEDDEGTKGKEEGSEEEEKGDEEKGDEEEEEEAPPKKKKKPKKKPEPEPEPDDDTSDILDDDTDPEVRALKEEEAALSEKRKALRIRKEIEKEEKDLADRYQKLLERKRQSNMIPVAIEKSVEKSVAEKGPEQAGTEIGESLARVAKKTQASGPKLVNIILKSMGEKMAKAVGPYIRRAMSPKAPAKKTTAQRAERMDNLQQAKDALAKLKQRVVTAGMTNAFAPDDVWLVALVDLAIDDVMLTDMGKEYVRDSVPKRASVETADVASDFALLCEDHLRTVFGDKAQALLDTDAVAAIYSHLTGLPDGLEPLMRLVPEADLVAAVVALEAPADRMEAAIVSEATNHVTLQLAALAQALSIAVEQQPEDEPVILTLVEMPFGSMNAFDALSVLRSCRIGLAALGQFCPWAEREHGGTVFPMGE